MKEEGASTIMAGLKNPTPDVSEAIAEVKAKWKGECPILSFISPLTNQDIHHFPLCFHNLHCIMYFHIISRC